MVGNIYIYYQPRMLVCRNDPEIKNKMAASINVLLIKRLKLRCRWVTCKNKQLGSIRERARFYLSHV